MTVFHDLQHKRHPEYFRWFDLPFWRFFLWLSARRSRLLLADSEATAKDLLHFYPFAVGKVRVAPLGVDPKFFEVAAARRPHAGNPYLLAVSTLHPHKNLLRLLDAFAIFCRSFPGYRLIITGLRGFHTAAVESRIRQLGLEDQAILTGWVDRERVYALFREATLFVYPSTFEGFGLPLLEAFAAAVPTVCTAVEPLASLAGDAALLCPPDESEAMAAALCRLAADQHLQAELTRRGQIRARQFSWRATAQQTLDALHAATS